VACDGEKARQEILYEEYSPYGSTSYRASKSGIEVSARRYRYTGKERDEETGLYYYGARYYAAWLGRWTSADPLGLQAGVNLYLYCRAGPVTYVDPDGMAPTPFFSGPPNPERTKQASQQAAAGYSSVIEKGRQFLRDNADAVAAVGSSAAGLPGALANLAAPEATKAVTGAAAGALLEVNQRGLEAIDPRVAMGAAASLPSTLANEGISGTFMGAVRGVTSSLDAAKESLGKGDAVGFGGSVGKFAFDTLTMALGVSDVKLPTIKTTPAPALATAGGGTVSGGVGTVTLEGGGFGPLAGAPASQMSSESGGDGGGDDRSELETAKEPSLPEFFDIDEAVAEALKSNDVPAALRGKDVLDVRRLGDIGPVKDAGLRQRIAGLGYDPAEFRAVQYQVGVEGGGQGVITVFETEGGSYVGPHWSSSNH